jgi:CHAT domain-containing protein
VHIASHGLVESNVKNTFVLAFDQKITMDRLAELVGLFRFRKAPLELLTLSACETAAGDDRAALGLAGVAVKAGARSALATLWFIDDAVTSDLIGEFYKQLQNPTLSKAQALQKAQVKILKDPRYQHPNFWAPFLLINNWL